MYITGFIAISAISNWICKKQKRKYIESTGTYQWTNNMLVIQINHEKNVTEAQF